MDVGDSKFCLLLASETIDSCWTFFENLLNHGVIIRPLSSNEMPDFVRISIGTKEEMDHFYESMDKLLPAYLKL